MSERVLTIGLAEDLIETLADYLEENYIKKGKDFSRLAIVFGGKRPVLFLKKTLSERIGRSFFAPKFFAIDEFVRAVVFKDSAFTRITDLDLNYLVFRLAQDIAPELLKERKSFADFLPWAREIAAFIEQIDLENISLESLKNIQAQAEIGYSIPPDINLLLENIMSLRQACHQTLEKEKKFSRGLQYLKAAELSSKIDFEEYDEIIFCGFLYLHKTEQEMLKNFYQKGKTVLMFQGDERDWPVLKNVGRHLDLTIVPGPQKKISPPVKLYSGFDTHVQIGFVREILKEIVRTKGVAALEKTVIVLPEPDHVVPLLSEVAALVQDFNVSLGYPLKRSSFFSLFDFVFNAQGSRKDQVYYSRDYLKAIRHPFVKNLEIFPSPQITRILIHKIEEILTGQERAALSGSLFFNLNQIEDLDDLYELSVQVIEKIGMKITRVALKQGLKEVHRQLFKNWESIGHFMDFSHVLEGFLDFFVNKSFLKSYPLNIKIASSIFALKEELKGAAFNREHFPAGEIFKIFEDRVEKEMMAFSGSPLKGLQILGLFETRSLNFDQVIVMDVNEGILPKLCVLEPLIPREVMISLNLDRVEQEEEIQRYQFMRLLMSAQEVHLVYEESRDRERSRFIEEIVWNKEKEDQALSEIKPLKGKFRIQLHPKQSAIEKTPEVLEFLKNFRYSASSINTYVHCPLRFYYHHVLGLNEKEDLLEEPENREIGNFVHGLLEDTFKPFLNRRPEINGHFRERFFKALDEKFKNEFEKFMKADSFLVKKVLDVRLSRFLDNEALRNVQKLVSIEERFIDTIPLAGRDMSFVYKADRIDETADGSLLILDYKTGSQDPMPKDSAVIASMEISRENIKTAVSSFQLPLYYRYFKNAYPEKKVNAALYNLRTTKVDHFLDSSSAEDPQILEPFMKTLDFTMQEILDPDAAFKPDDSNPRLCSHCPFYNVCR